MAAPALHPAVQPLSFLLGTWRGEGEGRYSTISSFKFGEEIQLWHTGQPVIAYTQKTWSLPNKQPMHSESGYWRPSPEGSSLEVVITQITGIAEVQKGSYDASAHTIDLESSLVGNASKVTGIRRHFHVVGDTLKYTVDMSTKTQPMQPHLQAELKKVE